jgi:hypothetical protein
MESLMIASSSRRTIRSSREMASAMLLMLAAAAPVAAQGAPTRPTAPSGGGIFVNAELTDVGIGATGRTAAIEWLHPVSAASALNTGLSSFSLADVAWTYGRFGAMRRVATRTVLHGQVDAGAGREQGQRFTYLAAQGTLDQTLVDGRLALQIQDRYVDIHTTTGNIAKIGLAVLPIKPLKVEASYHSSIGGSLDTRSITLRADGHRRGFSVFTGVSTGRTENALVGLGVAFQPAQPLNEIFAGTTIPVRRLRLTVTADSLKLGATEKRTVSVSWFVPL